jgi:hypothetical protein
VIAIIGITLHPGFRSSLSVRSRVLRAIIDFDAGATRKNASKGRLRVASAQIAAGARNRASPPRKPTRSKLVRASFSSRLATTSIDAAVSGPSPRGRPAVATRRTGCRTPRDARYGGSSWAPTMCPRRRTADPRSRRGPVLASSGGPFLASAEARWTAPRRGRRLAPQRIARDHAAEPGTLAEQCQSGLPRTLKILHVLLRGL